MGRLTKTILWLLIANAFMFVVLESAAWLWLQRVASDEQFYLYASRQQLENRFDHYDDITPKYALHRYIGYYPNPNHRYRLNRHNALGFRGDEIPVPKPENEFRIVCLGGSATYTGFVNDYHKSYPAQLEQALQGDGWNVRVINGAAEAYTSYEALLTFQLRVLELEPDLIIVYLGTNDIIERFVWPPEYYRADNSGSRGPVVSALFMPPIWEYSTFIRIRLIRAGLAKPHSDLPTFYDVHEPSFYGFEWRDQKRAGEYPSGIFADADGRTMLNTNPPTHFRRNVELLVAAADRFGVKTVLATFAHCPDFPNEPWVHDPEFTWAYDESNALLHDIAAQSNAALFDFAQAFPLEKSYFIDGIHMNEDGAQLKAQLFAAFLTSEKLIPEIHRRGMEPK